MILIQLTYDAFAFCRDLMCLMIVINMKAILFSIYQPTAGDNEYFFMQTKFISRNSKKRNSFKI